ARIGVVDYGCDLAAAGHHELPVLRPRGGRVVERVALSGDLEKELEFHRAPGEPLCQLVAEIVAPALASLVVRDGGLVHVRPPAVPHPGALAAAVDELERMGRPVGEGGETQRWLAVEGRLDRRLRFGVFSEEGA